MKKKNRKKREWVRWGEFDEHHITNKCNGGQTVESNLIRMDIRRHQAFHLLFHDLTFKEAASLLLRVWRIKQARAERWAI